MNNLIVNKHIPLCVNLIGELFPESISQAEKARLSYFHRKVETESFERFIRREMINKLRIYF